jgi:hypothetical protein
VRNKIKQLSDPCAISVFISKDGMAFRRSVEHDALVVVLFLDGYDTDPHPQRQHINSLTTVVVLGLSH